MSLLDKYIVEVGKHLPRKNRLDLQTEIRSTLEDMLEDRSREAGRPVDEAMISEVLQEFGAPAKVAASYQPARYLIGPRTFPLFELLIKIVSSVLIMASLIGFGLRFWEGVTTGPAFIQALGNWALQLMGSLISAFGSIVLVFAILERVLPASEFEQDEEKWVPALLNAEPDPDEVKRSELIVETLFIVLGLVLLNLYPQVRSMATLQSSPLLYLLPLSEAFYSYLPWINLLGVLTIALNLFLLRQGAWTTLTRLASLGLDLAGILLAGAMLVGPALVDTALLSSMPGAGANEVLVPLMNVVPKIALVIVIVVQSIEAVQIIWRLVGSRNAPKAFLPKA